MQGAAVTATAFASPIMLEKVFVEHQGRVFLRLARQGEDSLPLTNPGSYLYRAAVNSALDLLRARRDRPTVPLDDADEALEGSPGPDRRWEAAEIRGWLRRAMAALPPRAAEMFVLRYLEGQQNRDIARMLGVSRITVAVTLHRARQRLKDELRILMRGGR